MKRKIMAAFLLLLASSLAISGCNSWVSREDYESVTDELNTSRAEIEKLQTHITDMEKEQELQVARLNEKIEALTAERDTAQTRIDELEDQLNYPEVWAETESVLLMETAWNRAAERYKAMTDIIPILDDLWNVAPWLKFPDKPTWFDSARISSIMLADEFYPYKGLCIVEAPGKQMFITVSESAYILSAIYQGGSQDYEVTVVLDENGSITREILKTGDTECLLTWETVVTGVLFTADINGAVYQIQWSDDPENFASFCANFISWLESIGRDGGLISPSDRNLIILGLGKLQEPAHTPAQLRRNEIFKRAVSDICCGVPQTSLL